MQENPDESNSSQAQSEAEIAGLKGRVKGLTREIEFYAREKLRAEDKKIRDLEAKHQKEIESVKEEISEVHKGEVQRLGKEIFELNRLLGEKQKFIDEKES